MPPAQVPSSWQYAAPVQHDDVIVVPEFFCKEEDWDTYYALIKDPEGVLQLPVLGVKSITMPGDARKPSQAKPKENARHAARFQEWPVWHRLLASPIAKCYEVLFSPVLPPDRPSGSLGTRVHTC